MLRDLAILLGQAFIQNHKNIIYENELRQKYHNFNIKYKACLTLEEIINKMSHE